MRAEHTKALKRLKKAAEMQMRNIKLLAKDKAKEMLEQTVRRINKQFQQEVLSMLEEFQSLKEQIYKRD